MADDTDNKGVSIEAIAAEVAKKLLPELQKSLIPEVDKRVNTGLTSRIEQYEKTLVKKAGLDEVEIDQKDMPALLKQLMDSDKKKDAIIKELQKKERDAEQRMLDRDSKEHVRAKLKQIPNVNDKLVNDYVDKWYDLDKRIGRNDNGSLVVRFQDELGQSVEEPLDAGLKKLINTEYSHVLVQKSAPRNTLTNTERGSITDQFYGKNK